MLSALAQFNKKKKIKTPYLSRPFYLCPFIQDKSSSGRLFSNELNILKKLMNYKGNTSFSERDVVKCL